MVSKKSFWFKTMCLILVLSLAVPMFAFANPSPSDFDYNRSAVYTAEEGNIARLPHVRQLTNTSETRYNPNTGAGISRTGINCNYVNDSYGVPSVQVLRLTDGVRPGTATTTGYLSWAYSDAFGVNNRLYFVLNFGEEYNIHAVRCEWWTDGNVSVPNSEARVEWLDGTVWREVTNMRNPVSGAAVTNIGTLARGSWNPVTFDPVTTTQIRLRLHRTGTITNGIGVGEWEVFGALAQQDPCDDCDEAPCVCLPEIEAIGAVTGSLLTGRTLTAGAVTFKKNTATTGFSYQWQSADSADGAFAPIPEATARTYVIDEEDVGKFIRVSVTGNGETVLGSAVSAPVGPVIESGPAVIVFNVEGELPTTGSGFIGEAVGILPTGTRRSGFNFVGWFTAPEGGLAVTASTVIDQATFNIYARYNPVPKVGNEHFQKNLEMWPNMYNESTGRVRAQFSNDAARVINEVVWIEVPVDTDLDGQRDLQRIIIRRPIETLPQNGGLVVPAIVRLSPYRTSGGTGNAFATFSGRQDTDFIDQGKAPTQHSHLKFKDMRRPEARVYGPENDVSYSALRSVVDRVVGVGPEAHVATHKQLLEHDMMKRQAHEYTDWHRENFPWLPPARTPTGSQLNGTTFATAPGAAGPWSAATFIPLGMAAIQVDILGNDFAQGILQYGMYQESLAAAAVVDWLNGRIRGYTNQNGTVEVVAYWATGEAAMSGTSYDGTLPMAAALTGVEGLRTIFPGGPVTNAYNYFRENGAFYGPGGYPGEDIRSTTYYTFGRGWSASSVVHPTPQIWDTWWDWLLYLRDEGKPDHGDYSPFWDERNPLSYGFDMRKDVGVIIGHGFNDGNVKFRNAYQLNEMLKYYEIEVVKGLFHQGGHSMGNSRTGAWTTTAVMTEWIEHYLYGIASTVTTRTPNYSIERNLSTGSWTNYDTWPLAEKTYQKFYPTGGRVGDMALRPQQQAAPLTFKDTLLPTLARTTINYETTANGLAAHIRTNGVGNQNGFLKQALIHQGQGVSLPSSGLDRWRNVIVGNYNATTAWSGSERRLLTSSSALTANLSLTAPNQDRLLYYMDIPAQFTISGTVAITAEVAAHRDTGVISAMVLDRSSTGIKIVAMGSVDVRNPNPDGTLASMVPGLDNIEKGGNWHPNYLFQSADIIPYGTETPIAENFNSYTWEMDITEYTFRAGNKLGLIIYGSDAEFTVRPRTATEFTVNIGPNTYLQLPVIGYVPSAEVTFDAGENNTVSPSVKTFVQGEPFGELPRPGRLSGHSFAGWFTAPEGGVQVTAATIVAEHHEWATLYARYNAVPNVGNKWLMYNLEMFPGMYDPATGRTMAIFSNANDRVIQEEVWIEVPVDTDFDGKRDLQRIVIRRPIETLPENGGLVVPVLATLTPYQTTMGRPGFSPFFNPVDSNPLSQGAAATWFTHRRFVDGHVLQGPEGDLSYNALRAITDQRVGVGPNAHVARYRELLDHDMLMREASQYTEWHRTNFAWLPPARTPTGLQQDGNPIKDNVEQTTPGTGSPSAGAWGSSADMIPRGYAMVTVNILGSNNAEGMLQYGMYQESLCAAALVDWLNGRIRGYSDPTGTTEVVAYWATGEAAMSGTSYGGTLPLAAAVTGVEGLRTIAPGCPVTNAYNYFKENGTNYAPGGWQGEVITSTTSYCFGRGWQVLGSGDARRPGSVVSPTPAIWDTWWSWLEYLFNEMDAKTADFSPFWDERNPLSFGDDMRKDVGVIQFHGLNDDNVKFRHTALMNDMLKHYEIDVVKGFFHQAGHSMGQTRTGTWFTNAVRDNWLDYYMWGLENGVTDSVPNYYVESNLAVGQWTSYDTWPAATEHKKLYPVGDRVGVLSEKPQVRTFDREFQDDIVQKLVRPDNSDAFYVATDLTLAPFIRTNGVNNLNGWLRNARIHAGHGQAMAAAQYNRWRSMLVGGVDDTTAWVASNTQFATGTTGRFPVSPSLAYDFTLAIPDRLLYTMPITENFTISGTVAMTAEIAADKDVGIISAMVVEIAANNTVRVVARGSVDVRNPNPAGTLSFDVPALKHPELGGNWHANYLFQPTNTVPGEFYEYTFELDITEYTFRAGRQLGLIIFGSDPEFTYRPLDATGFKVNVGPRTFLQLPIIGYAEETDTREEFQKALDLLTDPDPATGHAIVFEVSEGITAAADVEADLERQLAEIFTAHRIDVEPVVKQLTVGAGWDGRYYLMPPAGSQYEIFWVYGEPAVFTGNAVPSARVTVVPGNTNGLAITIAERFTDGSDHIFSDSFIINNNAEGVYQVKDSRFGRTYNVFVDTKGNDQIRQIYFVTSPLPAPAPDPVVKTLVNAVTDTKGVKISGNDVWDVSFSVTETYSDGSVKVVPYVVKINKNSSGQVNLGAYSLVYDIAGNGSNIKTFRIAMK